MLSAGEILFATSYSAICVYLILKLSLFKRFELSPKLVAFIFLFKVFTAILYGLIHYYFYQGGDTFDYFENAVVIRNSLSEHPSLFLKLVFGINTRPPDAGIISYARAMGYWNDSSSYFLVRFHALASLITVNHYYANAVIYNFLTLTGILFLFRFLNGIIPAKKTAILFVLFFFPSVTFWASGIHKDGISLAALGLILYFTTRITYLKSPYRNRIVIGNIFYIFFGWWLLLIVRPYLLMLLIPCLAGFIWISIFPKNALLKLSGVFLSYFLIILNLWRLIPEWNLLQKMKEQQLEFFLMPAGTINLHLHEIQPDIFSFINLIPDAVINCLFHPGIWEISSFIHIIPAADNLLLIVLILFSLFFLRKLENQQKALFLFCIFFSLSLFIFVGSIVPNAGALVRYRMPGILFFTVAWLSLIDFEKLKTYRLRK